MSRKVMPSRSRMNRDLMNPPPDGLKDFIAKLTGFIADFSAPDLGEPIEIVPEVIEIEPEPVVASTWTGQGSVMCLCDDGHEPTRRWSPEYQSYIEASQALKASRRHLGLTASAPLADKETAHAAWQGSLILDDLDQTQAEDIIESLEEGT